MPNQIIEIDGSFGSGGGQILRTAAALATITKKPCRIFNIRAKRPKPGLMPQHLLGIQALARFCRGRLEGDFPGSQEIKFYPGENYTDRISVSFPTAGSITLVLQSLIPPALFGQNPVMISFNGGATATFFSPTIDHFRYAFLKILEKFIKDENRSRPVEVRVLKQGYYPEGGGKIEVKVFPSKLKPLDLTQKGQFKKILAISGASELLKTKKVAERQIAGTREILGKLKLPVEERTEYYDTHSPGSQICLIAEFENTLIGCDNLGKLGKRAEDVGRECALELLKEQKSGACLDKHLADQILPYLALSAGKSRISVSEISKHSQTNIWVIEKFLEGKFETKNNLITWKKFQ